MLAHQFAGGGLGDGLGAARRALAEMRVNGPMARRRVFAVDVWRQPIVEVPAPADVVSHVSLPSPSVPPPGRGAPAGPDTARGGLAKSETSPCRSVRSARPPS